MAPTLIGDKNVRIVAFDVFDTVLTRAAGSPESFFLLLGRRLRSQGLISFQPEVFAKARISADAKAHQNCGGPATRLTDIYKELEAIANGGSAPLDELMGAEYLLEAELLRVVPGADARIKQARKSGRRIVFISDMYLSQEFIFAQLLNHHLAEPGDGCYVSSEHQKWKQDGGLFQAVLKNEGISPDQMAYLGNNATVDIHPARQIKIKAVHFNAGNLNRYEKIWESESLATGGFASAVAGASRLARLNVAAGSAPEETIRDFAASIVAPTLAGYVIWLLLYAQTNGLTRLYFLSRDGEYCWPLPKCWRESSGLIVNCATSMAAGRLGRCPPLRMVILKKWPGWWSAIRAGPEPAFITP